MKIASIVGARPQFVKAAQLSNKIRKQHQEILIHTGQHYDIEMSEVFFKQLKIPNPDINLNVGSGEHGAQTAKMIKGIEDIFIRENPDLVITYGDTNSTLAGALVASKMHIKTAHVEAGLRSFNKKMPEEINRIVADQVSDVLFAPTKTAVENLKKESTQGKVYHVGDVMYDAILEAIEVAKKRSDIIRRLKLGGYKYALLTVHRAENTDEVSRLSDIIEAFEAVKIKVVFPVHPRTHKVLRQSGLLKNLEKNKDMILTDPLSYLDFLLLEQNASKIVTDSGGVQKEAYFLGVPCITLRNETEWVETVEDGWNIVVGTNKKKIIEAIETFKPKGRQKKVFGDGNAAKYILNVINKL